MQVREQAQILSGIGQSLDIDPQNDIIIKKLPPQRRLADKEALKKH